MPPAHKLVLPVTILPVDALIMQTGPKVSALWGIPQAAFGDTEYVHVLLLALQSLTARYCNIVSVLSISRNVTSPFCLLEVKRSL